MRDENGKIVAPDNFITAAERYGITPSIDRWVIENAFRWLSRRPTKERDYRCARSIFPARAWAMTSFCRT